MKECTLENSSNAPNPAVKLGLISMSYSQQIFSIMLDPGLPNLSVGINRIVLTLFVC